MIKTLLSLAFATLLHLPLLAQNAVTALSLRIDASFEHVSVLVLIADDSNLDSELSVQFRQAGTSTWHNSAPSQRADPNSIVDGASLNRNHHAASALFLDPGSTYEMSIVLSDPDGGGTTWNPMVSTKSFPAIGQVGSLRYVSPGNGGGTGTMADPYLGLQTAANNAAAGDCFIVADGSYSPFSLSTSGTALLPIRFISENQFAVLIDGGNTNAGVITLGTFNDSLQHVIIDGFSITDGAWGIDAQNTQFLTVRNCSVTNVDYGFVNRRENGWEHDQLISDNEFEGRTLWPQLTGNIPSERGVDIRGNNNTVIYNRITDFGDGISTDGNPYGVSYSLDIYYNDIDRIVDDPIEVDGMVANTRIYRNRVYNGRMGVSVAPVLGGPCYVFRNEFYNIETSMYKMNRSPSGLFIVHNTGLKEENGSSSPAGWQNTVVKNNLIMCSRYVFEEYGLVGSNDWTHNGYYSTRAGTSAEPWFKWDNVKYDDLSDLQANTSSESSSISLLPSTLVNAAVPLNYGTYTAASSVDLTLESSSTAINTGISLNNLNEPFVSDGTPDLGAFEYGEAYPDYGPRWSIPTSIEDHTSVQVKLYPNPGHGWVAIQASCRILQVEVLGHGSRLLRTVRFKPNMNVEFAVSELPAGIYHLRIHTVDGVLSRSIVKL